jgi:hypothetical protein
MDESEEVRRGSATFGFPAGPVPAIVPACGPAFAPAAVPTAVPTAAAAPAAVSRNLVAQGSATQSHLVVQAL